MNKKSHIDRTTDMGKVITWAKVSKSGKIKVQKYVTHHEKGEDLDQWLPLFDSGHEVNAYILAKAHGSAPLGLQWAAVELTAYGPRDPA